jgi:hypothetical protein
VLTLREENRRLARKLHYAEEKINMMERERALGETMFEFNEVRMFAFHRASHVCAGAPVQCSEVNEPGHSQLPELRPQ